MPLCDEKEIDMAVTVIGEDADRKKRTSCRKCAAILEYTLSDTRTETVKDYGGGSDTYRRLDCPRCKAVLDVPMY
jgi:hypothetical protein